MRCNLFKPSFPRKSTSTSRQPQAETQNAEAKNTIKSISAEAFFQVLSDLFLSLTRYTRTPMPIMATDAPEAPSATSSGKALFLVEALFEVEVR